MLNLSGLNEAQREAVIHGEGPALVIAGPGSGKTHVITSRISYLIEQRNVSPEKILVITFTKEAALSMQQRFQAMNTSYLPVHFGTFHSFFYHILRESNRQTQFNILTQKQKQNLLLPILKQFPIEQNPYDARERIQEELTAFMTAISFYKNTGDKETATTYLSEEWQPFFDTIFTKYENARKRERVIDFDDMLYECKVLLENSQAVRARWQQYFSYILIDEFQDINPMQYEVVKLLSRPPYSIFAVGDDDQSIYGFRGASPECLQQFRQDYDAKEIYLTKNYRSNAEIVECSLSVINENRHRFVKALKAGREDRDCSFEAVTWKGYLERNDEYYELSKEIRDYSEKYPENTCAVLFRTNLYMQSMAMLLGREKIPFQMREQKISVYEQGVIKDIMAYLELANTGLARDAFVRIMNKPHRFINRNALGSGEISFKKLRDYYFAYGNSNYQNDILMVLEQLERQLEMLKGKTPFLAVQYIRKVIGYDNYIKNQKQTNAERWRDDMEILEWITEDAKKYSTYHEWIAAQKECTVVSGKGQEEKGVWLLTVHASKGLEFDHVWIVDCNEKNFPHGTLLTDTQVEEERRIFYVAMTRAKKSLKLCFLTGTEERPKMLSRFLQPILQRKKEE